MHFFHSSDVWWWDFLVFGLGTIVTFTSTLIGVRRTAGVPCKASPGASLAPCAAVKGGEVAFIAGGVSLVFVFVPKPPGKFGTLRQRLFRGLFRVNILGGIGQEANAFRSQRPDGSQVGRPGWSRQREMVGRQTRNQELLSRTHAVRFFGSESGGRFVCLVQIFLHTNTGWISFIDFWKRIEIF